jgi:hypothetical protein
MTSHDAAHVTVDSSTSASDRLYMDDFMRDAPMQSAKSDEPR